MHKNNAMGNLLLFYSMMFFLLPMLINVCTLHLKKVNVSLYVFILMTLFFGTCNDIVYITKLFMGFRSEMKDMSETKVIL